MGFIELQQFGPFVRNTHKTNLIFLCVTNVEHRAAAYVYEVLFLLCWECSGELTRASHGFSRSLPRLAGQLSSVNACWCSFCTKKAKDGHTCKISRPHTTEEGTAAGQTVRLHPRLILRWSSILLRCPSFSTTSSSPEPCPTGRSQPFPLSPRLSIRYHYHRPPCEFPFPVSLAYDAQNSQHSRTGAPNKPLSCLLSFTKTRRNPQNMVPVSLGCPEEIHPCLRNAAQSFAQSCN